MHARKATIQVLLLAALCAGCVDNDISAPYRKNLVIEVVAGDRQFAAPGAPAAEPLQVRISHVKTGAPVKNLIVHWRVVRGNGIELTPSATPTDSAGLAATHIRLGTDIGEYRIEATFDGLFGRPPAFVLHSAPPPSITEIQPQVTPRPGSGRGVYRRRASTTHATSTPVSAS
jgi:hypothetical protein